STQTADRKRQVLPTNVRPTHYDLTLTPDLQSFTFKGTETVNQNAVEISHDTHKQTVTLTFPEKLHAGAKAALHLEFTGILNDKMNGFYRSSYKDTTTQFEATDARRAFPSWDEPAIKATFDITLIVPSELTALSNMNVVSETPHEVGDLAYVEASTTGIHNGGKPVLVRSYATRGSEHLGQFALDVAVEVLEYFAEVFGIPYPLPKCDMVAIPDFEAGAMENWGLITYRTSAILFDPKASDAKFKQRIAYTVSHELAHQIFDAISYYKGASVIRMLSSYIGVDVFLSGVRRYLKRYEYSNASTDDLWKALTEESGTDVGQFMTGWTRVVDELESKVLTTKETELSLPHGADFYKFNSRVTGIFRVSYTPERLAKLGHAVKQGLLDTSDRVGLVADAGALATSGYAKTSGLLNLINEFDKEDKYIVWFEQPEPVYQGLLAFQRHLVSKLVPKLGWEYPEKEDYLITMLRTLVIKVAGRSKDPEVVKEAFRRFELFTKKNDKSALHPNIRGSVYEIVLGNGGGANEFDAILKIYREADTVDQKLVALTGLGFAQHEDLIKRALNFSLSEEVKNQDIIYAFSGLYAAIIKYGTDAFSTDADLKDVENFFSNKNTKDYLRPLQQSLESIRVNTAWLTRDKEDVENWLRTNGYLQ
ncbi:19743_t:CDS:10, partial [Racocetra fulgida]